MVDSRIAQFVVHQKHDPVRRFQKMKQTYIDDRHFQPVNSKIKGFLGRIMTNVVVVKPNL
jgi:peptide deformylase